MVALVERLASDLSVPVTVKLRLLPERDASIALCKRLESAGASVLCLHGRTREQNKQFAGRADWEPIREVVTALDIPVIANGGIETRADVDACLEYTGAAAVMSSEALLENPALFCANVHPETGEYLDQSALARRYLEICEEHPPSKGAAVVRGHLFKLLHHGLRTHTDLRDELLLAQSLEEMGHVVAKLDDAGWDMPNFHAGAAEHATGASGRVEQLDLSWYRRHRTAAEEGSVGDGKTAERTPLSRDELEAAALQKRQNKKRAKRARYAKKREAGGRDAKQRAATPS